MGLSHLILCFVVLVAVLCITNAADGSDGWYSSANPAQTPSKSQLIELHANNFRRRLNKHKTTAILFYVKNNRYAQSAQDIISELSNSWNETDLAFAQVDCIKQAAVCSHFDLAVQFPALQLYSSSTGKTNRFQSIHWTKESISSWLRWYTSGFLTDINLIDSKNPSNSSISSAILNFVSSSPNYLIGLFSTIGNEYYLFSRIAEDSSMKPENSLRFAALHNVDMVSLREGGIWPGVPLPRQWGSLISRKINSPNALLLHYEGTTHVLEFTSRVTRSGIEKWISRHTKTSLAWLDFHNMTPFLRNKKPILVYFSTLGRNFEQAKTPLLTSSQTVFKSLKRVSSKWADKYQFSYTDQAISRPWMDLLSIDSNVLESLVLYDHTKNLHFIFPYDQPMEYKNIEKWLRGIIDGSVSYQMRSARGYPTHFPANERGLLTRVNNQNWESIVDHSKNVLVAFLEPWHAASKRLWPILVSISKEKSQTPDVSFAMFDCHLDTFPLHYIYGKYQLAVQQYPALLLFKKDGSAVEYQGEFTKEQIQNWLKKAI